MEIIKKTINNNNYTFVCETWETSRAWGHKVTLFRNDTEYTTQKITYYNRTWESYRYQTCMLKCIDEVIAEEVKNAIEEVRELYNIKRISKDEKESIIAELEKRPYYKELKELRKLI